MKKYQSFIVAVVLFAACAGGAGISRAAEPAERVGPFGGVGFGGGLLVLKGGGATSNDGALNFTGTFGLGLRDTILLTLGEGLTYSKIGAVNFYIYNTLLGVQWFPVGNFYVHPELGINVASASVTAGGATVAINSNIGLSGAAAFGYEFRLGANFALSPEATYNYSNIRSGAANANNHVFGGGVDLRMYF